jgi:hypothetical protein
MTSECSRAACANGPQHVQLLIAQPGAVLFSKAVTLDSKDSERYLNAILFRARA